jgi:ribosomal 50S subunit-recycling heat shock protein
MSEWELPASVEAQSIERVGGSYAWESGVYDATTKMVYLNQSAAGAVSFNVILENSSGKELKESFWIKSGNAKGNKTYYTGKDGKDRPLPGYATANSMCVATTGDSLAKCMDSAEKKTINLYNAEAGKEVPTERPVLMSLMNTALKVAVHQVSEDRTKKNDATGQYEPTGESRIVNECKFFGNTEGKTAEEILENKDAVMFDKWAAKNTGTVIDKTTKTNGTASAASIMGGDTAAPAPVANAGATSSMFS